ncbi:MAG: hypothetical protein V1681_05170 [Candidatus Neomarinimicrobiota bacterium]
MTGKPTLPTQTENSVIDVSLKQALKAFSGLVFTTLAVGVSIVLLRDYAKYKRQKAIIDAVTELLLTLNPGSARWKEEKKPMESQSSLPTKN